MKETESDWLVSFGGVLEALGGKSTLSPELAKALEEHVRVSMELFGSFRSSIASLDARVGDLEGPAVLPGVEVFGLVSERNRISVVDGAESSRDATWEHLNISQVSQALEPEARERIRGIEEQLLADLEARKVRIIKGVHPAGTYNYDDRPLGGPELEVWAYEKATQWQRDEHDIAMLRLGQPVTSGHPYGVAKPGPNETKSVNPHPGKLPK